MLFNREKIYVDKIKVMFAILTSAHPSSDTRIFHKDCKTLNNEGYNVILEVCSA